MDELSSEEIDLFGDDSEDDFVPPTSCEDSDEGLSLFSRMRKKRRTMGSTDVGLPNNKTPLKTPPRFQHIDHIEADLQDTRSETNETIGQYQTPKKPRKVVANPLKWKCNIRKMAHQKGKSYLSKRGKVVPERTVQTFKNCNLMCKFKCCEKVSISERSELHESFYSLCSTTEKRHFIINTTSRSLTARPKRMLGPDHNQSDDVEVDDWSADEDETEKSGRENTNSRRKFSFRYFFFVKGEKIQVCKPFYLGTLDISQKPVYTAHATKNVETNTPTQDRRGTNKNSRRVPKGNTESVREHIKSFPVIESHYCRAHTKREYLGSHLSIGKLYDLYLQKCSSDQIDPVKKSMYYRIFVTEFNLGFHSPKSDRCDLCEKYKVADQTQTLTEGLKYEYDVHQTSKANMREVRTEEKKDATLPVLLFDLENVILTPHANISSFFYLRKLNIYNLTAYFAPTKQVYCAIWGENLSGRAGNDIASAFYKILNVVAEENDLTQLITWSDSCVPQNRNSIISNSVIHFLQENVQVSSVTMKSSLPGHSCVQEIDNVHSMIEKGMSKTDFYSPIGLVRLLKQVSPRNPYRVIQMRPNDFKDFHATAKLLNYKTVPFASVSVLKFTRNFHTVTFKTSHDKFEPENFANIKFAEKTQRTNRNKIKKTNVSPTCASLNVLQVKPKVQKCKKEVSEEKKTDIKTAFPFMPIQDREYYSAIFNYS